MSTDDDVLAAKAARATSFGSVAQEYERYRPGYPVGLVDDVLAYAGLGDGSAGARVLDVGAGTGKGTRELVGRGLDVTALEPSAEMLAVLERELPGVRGVCATFEGADVAGPYDLLVSAQAWHWTDHGTHWQRAHDLLRPGGTIALWWNHSRLADVDAAAVEAVYARRCPHIDPDTGDGNVETSAIETSWPGPEMAGSPLLDGHEVRLYRWQRTQTRADYLAALDTQSPYRVLADDVRAAVFDDLAGVLPETVAQDYLTILHLARRV